MAFIPLHDKNPRVLVARPWVTWGLILVCSAVFAVQVSAAAPAGHRLVYSLGLIPATLTGEAELSPDVRLVWPVLTLVSYMFLHGGFLHLAGNMLFLWVFGDNIEDAMGHRRFIVFFLLGGALAGLVQVMVDPPSRVPTIGASGAVAAVLGAYLILHPRARILVPIFIFPVYLPAYILLVLWIAFQVITALSGGGGGVAWWAHIGGFIAGALLIVPFRHNSIPLFGADDLPSGITLRSRFARRRRPGDGDRKGPWE
ncbi:MAG: rhomboid family intramembrane serine protease [Kiloniellaceae bacterium]